MQDRGVMYKLALLFCLYFSQGLPFGFFSHAMPTLLRSNGVDLEIIGLVSFLAFPWGMKFLWAPWVDRWHIPAMGQRKSWILPLQLVAIGLLLGFSAVDPAQLASGQWFWLFVLLGLMNLVAATQDIATDGLAVQALPPAQRGLANGMQVGGYRVGMVFGGGLVLVLIAQVGWHYGFVALALLLALVTVPVLFLRESPAPAVSAQAELTVVRPDAPVTASPVRTQSAWRVLWHFVHQQHMWRWLLVMMLYKVGDSFGSAMGKPLLVDMGLPLDVIGWIGGGVGMGAGICGAIAGGIWVQRLGRLKAFVTFGVLQSVSLLGYAWLAGREVSLEAVVLVNVLEHFAGGMATAALFTLMMDACRHDEAGTDYTVQASLQVSIVGLAHGFSGFSAAAFGYGWHFVIAAMVSALVLLLVPLWLRRTPDIQRRAWQHCKV